MSQVGKTALRGHGLADEGKPHYNAQGFFRWEGGHAKCECGLLSEAGVSQAAAKRWHREHKDAVRALRAPQSDEQGVSGAPGCPQDPREALRGE